MCVVKRLVVVSVVCFWAFIVVTSMTCRPSPHCPLSSNCPPPPPLSLTLPLLLLPRNTERTLQNIVEHIRREIESMMRMRMVINQVKNKKKKMSMTVSFYPLVLVIMKKVKV
jgi:hypothetical protein